MKSKVSLEWVACPICGAANARQLHKLRDYFFGAPGEFGIVQCQACGQVYTNPRPTADTIADYYQDNYTAFDTRGVQPFRFLARPRKWLDDISRQAYLKVYLGYPNFDKKLANVGKIPLALQLLAQLKRDTPLRVKAQPGGRLLEVGCATGQHLANWRNLGWQVAGVELVETAAEYARSQRGLDVLTGTLFDAHFQDSSFNVVVYNHVLEHVYNPVAELVEVGRILKPGGRLVIGLPNYDSLGRRLFSRYWRGYEIPRHLFHWDILSLRRTLHTAGFENIVRQDYIFGWGIWLQSLVALYEDRRGQPAPNLRRRLPWLTRNLNRLAFTKLPFNRLHLSDMMEVEVRKF